VISKMPITPSALVCWWLGDVASFVSIFSPSLALHRTTFTST